MRGAARTWWRAMEATSSSCCSQPLDHRQPPSSPSASPTALPDTGSWPAATSFRSPAGAWGRRTFRRKGRPRPPPDPRREPGDCDLPAGWRDGGGLTGRGRCHPLPAETSGDLAEDELEVVELARNPTGFCDDIAQRHDRNVAVAADWDQTTFSIGQ